MNNYEEKVEEYFKLVYPEFDQLSIDNKLIAIEDEKLICEHFEEINEAYNKCMKEGSYFQKEGYSSQKILKEIIKSIKVNDYLSILYCDCEYNELNNDNKKNMLEDKRFLIDHIDNIDYLFNIYINQNESNKEINNQELLKEIIKSIKVQDLYDILYPRIDMLSIDERKESLVSKRILIDNINEIENKYKKNLQENSVGQINGWNNKKILDELICATKVEEYFNKMYPNYSELSIEEKIMAIKNKSILIKNINKVEKKYNYAINNENITNEKYLIEEIIKTLKVDEYINILYPRFESLTSSEKVNYFDRKKFFIDNLDEIEELYSEYIDENSWIQKKGYNEKRILSEVLRLVKTEKYYNKLYPDSNELACNQKIKAYRDRAFIYNNINEVERKYKELNNVNNVSEKEVIKKSIDSVKADNYFKELYANFDNLNKSERIKAYRDKITIKNNIEKIDEIITSNKEITLANAIKNIQVQETFEGLYPNFNELSIKDKIEALNKKKQLYKNTGNNISSKKYSNKFNKQSNKNTVSTRQKIEEKNNNLKNTLQSNDEYIEVNLSWKEKLINKINVIKRILKKQKALPENK